MLEFGLKNLLANRYKYEDMEKWTPGRTTAELKKCELRADFIKLLESVVTYRNYMAHEFLANHVNVRAHQNKVSQLGKG